MEGRPFMCFEPSRVKLIKLAWYNASQVGRMASSVKSHCINQLGQYANKT